MVKALSSEQETKKVGFNRLTLEKAVWWAIPLHHVITKFPTVNGNFKIFDYLGHPEVPAKLSNPKDMRRKPVAKMAPSFP